MKKLEAEQKNKLFRCIIGLILLVAVWAMTEILGMTEIYILLPLFLIPYFVVGYDVIIEAFENILHGEVFGECFLMVIATFGAFAIGEYPEAVAVLLFYQVGELLQDIAVDKSKDTVAALLEIKPDSACVIRDGKEETVLPEDVEKGEIIIVRPGERIPLDGVIEEGNSSLDTAAITGESMPRDVSTGDEVISGSINMSGILKIRTTNTYGQSTVARILEIAENAAEKRSEPEKFITKFAKIYTPAVVISALLLALIPSFITGEWQTWVKRACMFLVVSCPCALVISVPLSFFSGIGAASGKGILIKGANAIEALAKAEVFIFDKTGTLTKGAFKVSEIHPKGISESQLLCIAAYAECYSKHPIARSIVEAYGKEIDKEKISHYEEIAGKGIKADIGGKTITAGNEKLVDADEKYSGTAVYFAEDGNYIGCIFIADEIKEDSYNAINMLKAENIHTVMLTGDSKDTAIRIGNELQISDIGFALLPDGKANAISSYGDKTVFIGDGINDSPAMATASVGMAMGMSGSDAAIEAADIVIMDDRISKAVAARKISKETMSIVYENIFFSLFVKAAILILSACGLTGMWLAVFADVGVTVLAVINSIRLLLKKKY